MLGAPYDTMTLLHHAEHLADVLGKRLRRIEVPLRKNGRKYWKMIEEFNTGIPVTANFADNYFAQVVNDFLTTGSGQKGSVGKAHSIAVPAAEIVTCAKSWIETHA